MVKSKKVDVGAAEVPKPDPDQQVSLGGSISNCPEEAIPAEQNKIGAEETTRMSRIVTRSILGVFGYKTCSKPAVESISTGELSTEHQERPKQDAGTCFESGEEVRTAILDPSEDPLLEGIPPLETVPPASVCQGKSVSLEDRGHLLQESPFFFQEIF